MNIDIYHKDCFDFLLSLENESVNHAIIDPPYGVLTGHKIEREIDIKNLMFEIHRVLKADAFLCFFGQMPTIVEWCNEANVYFKFSDHISWAKRNITSPYLPVQRSHEEIMIYKKGNPKYVNTSEKYEDLKTPALHLGLYELSTIKTTISDLQRRLNEPEYNEKYYAGGETAHGRSNDEYYTKKYTSLNDSPRNDNFHKSMFQKRTNKKELRENQPANDELYADRDQNVESFRFRSKWDCNVTNVWSFLPENQTKFGVNGVNVQHPTVKPTRLLIRLIKLISNENETIVDCFSGSGSTAISCMYTNRNFKGCEIEHEYYEVSKERIKHLKSEFGFFNDCV